MLQVQMWMSKALWHTLACFQQYVFEFQFCSCLIIYQIFESKQIYEPALKGEINYAPSSPSDLTMKEKEMQKKEKEMKKKMQKRDKEIQKKDDALRTLEADLISKDQRMKVKNYQGVFYPFTYTYLILFSFFFLFHIHYV
jgi:hypothetical protein